MLDVRVFQAKRLTRRAMERCRLQALHRHEEVDALDRGVDRDVELVGPLVELSARADDDLLMPLRSGDHRGSALRHFRTLEE